METELKDQAETGLKDQAETELKDQAETGLKDQAETGLKVQAETELKNQAEIVEAGPKEAGLDLACVIDNMLDLPTRDWSQYSPLTLAWIGDTVYDLIVRTVLLKRDMMQPDKLHRKASRIVNAGAQAKLMLRLREQLTDREASIYRRGHNAKPAHKAKNADMRDYLEATGFECLIGYLYLTRQYHRIMELILAGNDSLQTAGPQHSSDRN